MRLALVAFVLFLAGCDVEVRPVEFGFFKEGFTSPKDPDRKPLSRAQIEALGRWFAERREGWTFKISDVYPGIYVCLEHRRGRPTWMNITRDRIWVRNWYRPLAPDEYAALRSILGLDPEK